MRVEVYAWLLNAQFLLGLVGMLAVRVRTLPVECALAGILNFKLTMKPDFDIKQTNLQHSVVICGRTKWYTALRGLRKHFIVTET